MVVVVADVESRLVTILGHGLTIADSFELAPGIRLSSEVPKLDFDAVASGCRRFADYAATISGKDIATFSLQITDADGGRALATKAWNALWLFHLLSVACRTPCFSLYSVSDGAKPAFSAASRTPFVRPHDSSHPASTDQLLWAQRHASTFDRLIDVPEFRAAMRCYGNAHYLPDLEVRIMLLWAGIEGLLSVDAELSRRLALYAALLHDGTPDEKAAYFDDVKKAYAVRSRAVHGAELKQAKLEEGYRSASRILVQLLARCVELGRVPSSAEMDRLAVSPILR